MNRPEPPRYKIFLQIDINLRGTSKTTVDGSFRNPAETHQLRLVVDILWLTTGFVSNIPGGFSDFPDFERTIKNLWEGQPGWWLISILDICITYICIYVYDIVFLIGNAWSWKTVQGIFWIFGWKKVGSHMMLSQPTPPKKYWKCFFYNAWKEQVM